MHGGLRPLLPGPRDSSVHKVALELPNEERVPTRDTGEFREAPNRPQAPLKPCHCLHNELAGAAHRLGIPSLGPLR